MANSATTLKCSFATAGTMLLAYLGGWDVALNVLFVFIVLDYITGVMVGIKSKTVSSRIGYNGIFKKVGILFLVIIATHLDMLVGAEVSIIGVDVFVFRSLVIMFYIANEAISVLENLVKLDVKVPTFLINFLKVYGDKMDSGGV